MKPQQTAATLPVLSSRGAGASLLTGAATGLFSSGSDRADTALHQGGGTGLFSSGSAPADDQAALTGDASGLFSSGS